MINKYRKVVSNYLFVFLFIDLKLLCSRMQTQQSTYVCIVYMYVEIFVLVTYSVQCMLYIAIHLINNETALNNVEVNIFVNNHIHLSGMIFFQLSSHVA